MNLNIWEEDEISDPDDEDFSDEEANDLNADGVSNLILLLHNIHIWPFDGE